MKTVRIIGAGFSGLTLAHELVKRRVPVEIFEKTAVGGMLQTGHTQMGLVESAANGFLACAEMEELAKELKLRLITPKAQAKRRYISRDGRLRRWPIGFASSLRLLSGLWRRTMDPQGFAPKAQETIEHFINRNFNQEILDYLAVPALQGIYGPGVKSLSAELVFGGGIKPRRGQRRGLVTFEKGMQSPMDAIFLSLKAKGVVVQNREFASKAEAEQGHVHVVAATGLNNTLSLLGLDSRWSHLKTKSLISITLWFTEERLPHGFGCLFPEQEKSAALGVLFNSDIFAGRTEQGTRSETWILDGARWQGSSDSELIDTVVNERKLRFGAKGNPVSERVFLWPRALPHYDVHLADFLIQEKSILDLHAHGNFLGGIGLSKIYCRSRLMAARLQEHLR